MLPVHVIWAKMQALFNSGNESLVINSRVARGSSWEFANASKYSRPSWELKEEGSGDDRLLVTPSETHQRWRPITDADSSQYTQKTGVSNLCPGQLWCVPVFIWSSWCSRCSYWAAAASHTNLPPVNSVTVDGLHLIGFRWKIMADWLRYSWVPTRPGMVLWQRHYRFRPSEVKYPKCKFCWELVCFMNNTEDNWRGFSPFGFVPLCTKLG